MATCRDRRTTYNKIYRAKLLIVRLFNTLDITVVYWAFYMIQLNRYIIIIIICALKNILIQNGRNFALSHLNVGYHLR